VATFAFDNDFPALVPAEAATRRVTAAQPATKVCWPAPTLTRAVPPLRLA
jgi:hypothetical protein